MNPLTPKEGWTDFYTIHKDDVVSVHDMTAYGGVEVQQYSLLTSALNGGG
jgi:hypothetical protein